jgi:hypothetical protein
MQAPMCWVKRKYKSYIEMNNITMQQLMFFLVCVRSCLFMSIDDLSGRLLLKDVRLNSEVDGPLFILLK